MLIGHLQTALRPIMVHTGECIHITQEELVKHFLENKYYEPCMYFKFKLIEIRAI